MTNHTRLPYAGENHFAGQVGAEVFTVGDSFSICLMQPGKNPEFVDELIKEFDAYGIRCSLIGEERYVLADFMLP